MNCRRGCSSVWSKELSAGPGDTTNRSSKQSHALAIVSTSLAAVLPTKTSPFDSDSPSLLYGSAYLQAIYPPPAEATSASSHPPQVKTSSAAPVIPSVFPPSQLSSFCISPKDTFLPLAHHFLNLITYFSQSRCFWKQRDVWAHAPGLPAN